MEYTVKQVRKLIGDNYDVVSSKTLNNSGISRSDIQKLVSKDILVKESHGNYILKDNIPDEYKTVQNRSDKLVYSHTTALFLNGMSDRVPHTLDIAVPQGNNISRIKKDYQNLRFHYCKKELWDLGIIDLKTPEGYTVKAYNPERCICDLIREKDSVDLQVYTQALKEYFSKNCNPSKIIKYAREFNIEEKVRSYMEVLCD